jgi:hypothetical protein
VLQAPVEKRLTDHVATVVRHGAIDLCGCLMRGGACAADSPVEKDPTDHVATVVHGTIDLCGICLMGGGACAAEAPQ